MAKYSRTKHFQHDFMCAKGRLRGDVPSMKFRQDIGPCSHMMSHVANVGVGHESQN